MNEDQIDLTLTMQQIKMLIKACRAQSHKMRVLRDRAKISFKQDRVYDLDAEASKYDEIASYLSEYDD